MNTTNPSNGPDHWRQRAREARSAADRLADPEAKRTMLEIAEAYERLVILTGPKK